MLEKGQVQNSININLYMANYVYQNTPGLYHEGTRRSVKVHEAKKVVIPNPEPKSMEKIKSMLTLHLQHSNCTTEK